MTRHPNPAPPKAHVSSSTTLRFAPLALVFITIIALAAVACFTERGIVVNRDWVIHTYQVRSQLNDLQLEVLRAKEDETDSLLMSGVEQGLQVREQFDLANRTVDQLRELTRDNTRQQERLEQLGGLLKENLAAIDQQAEPAGRPAHLSPGEWRRQEAIGEREKQMTSVVRSMQDDEESLLDQRLKAWDYLFKRNVLMLGLAFAVVTVLLAYNFRLLVSEVVRTKDTERQSRANAESYRLMSARILELQDSERRRIARELHDSVGQYLAGLKINLSQIESAGVDAPTMIRETLA
jgi:signal transduction histidine kinase